MLTLILALINAKYKWDYCWTFGFMFVLDLILIERILPYGG